MITRIAVIGATGTLGRPVALALASSGFAVTALVRDEHKARQILPQNIRLLKGALEDTESLNRVLDQQDALYINLNLNPSFKESDYQPEREGLASVLGMAEQKQLKRVAFISSLVMNYQGMNGFNWWVFDMKKQAVNMVRGCGIPYTIFYPSTFMENFETNYRKGNKILLAGKSICKQWFVSGADYGKQVARSFQLLTDQNREYTIQGPCGYTTDEAARIYLKANPNKKLSLSTAPLGLLRFLGNFSSKINYGAHIIEALNNYPEKFEAELAWDELGKPEIALEEYAAKQH